jgi:hypothetical protein
MDAAASAVAVVMNRVRPSAAIETKEGGACLTFYASSGATHRVNKPTHVVRAPGTHFVYFELPWKLGDAEVAGSSMRFEDHLATISSPPPPHRSVVISGCRYREYASLGRPTYSARRITGLGAAGDPGAAARLSSPPRSSSAAANANSYAYRFMLRRRADSRRNHKWTLVVEKRLGFGSAAPERPESGGGGRS